MWLLSSSSSSCCVRIARSRNCTGRTCGRDRSDLHVAGAFFNLSLMTMAAFATCLCHHCHRPSKYCCPPPSLVLPPAYLLPIACCLLPIAYCLPPSSSAFLAPSFLWHLRPSTPTPPTALAAPKSTYAPSYPPFLSLSRPGLATNLVLEAREPPPAAAAAATAWSRCALRRFPRLEPHSSPVRPPCHRRERRHRPLTLALLHEAKMAKVRVETLPW